MLLFDPQTGLSAQEVSEVRENVRADWVAAFQKDGAPPLDTDPETPAGQLIDSQTAAIVDKDSEILFLANQFNPLTSQGIWQDALGAIYFLKRKIQESSVAICTIMGLSGTVIPAGALIRSEVDNSQWACTVETTIPAGGTTTVPFAAVETGALEAGANTLTQIVTVIPGWDSVTNGTAAAVGRVVETQAEFETRRYASVAKNARGSLLAIYGAIADIPGVLDCVVLENVTNFPVVKWGVTIPGHSVWIAVVGGDDASIAEQIYRKKDAGCGTAGNTTVSYEDTGLPGAPTYEYTIERPTPLPFGVRVTIRETSATPAEIEQQVKNAILEDFEGRGPHGNLRVGMAQVVYASRFYCAAITAGATSLENIEICAPVSGGAWGDSVTINADQSPVLDAADITVTLVS